MNIYNSFCQYSGVMYNGEMKKMLLKYRGVILGNQRRFYSRCYTEIGFLEDRFFVSKEYMEGYLECWNSMCKVYVVGVV